jgi:hypothetical protein
MLGWLKALGIMLVTVLFSVLLIVVHILLKTEAVARTYTFSEELVEWQVRRLPSGQQPLYRFNWLGSIAQCKANQYPVTALFRAVVVIPHQCRSRLRTLAAEERATLGGWRPWTRTGLRIHRLAIQLIDSIFRESIRASLISPKGRINWTAIRIYQGVASRRVEALAHGGWDEILKDPSVVKASLFSEVDALENLLRDMGPDDNDRPIVERAYRGVIDLLHGAKGAAADMPVLVGAGAGAPPTSEELAKKVSALQRAEQLLGLTN